MFKLNDDEQPLTDKDIDDILDRAGKGFPEDIIVLLGEVSRLKKIINQFEYVEKQMKDYNPDIDDGC